MKRKTVLRSLVASTAIFSLTACGQANLTSPTSVANSSANTAPTTVTAAATEPDVYCVDAEPAEYPVFTDNTGTCSHRGIYGFAPFTKAFRSILFISFVSVPASAYPIRPVKSIRNDCLRCLYSNQLFDIMGAL